MTHAHKDRREFVSATFGLSAVMMAARSAEAQSAAPATQANIALVNEFCAAWTSRDLKAPLAFLADDVVYRMTETTPPVTGHAGVIERLDAFVKAANRVDFKVLDTWAAGPMVVNHRIDTFASATRPLVWEGVGVFFLKDGKIREWHDYTIHVTR